MSNKKQPQQKTPNGFQFSLYGNTDPSIGEHIEYSKQYKKAREILLKGGFVKPEELAVMTDGDVEELLDKYFAFVGRQDDTIAIIRRADIPALENMIILLKK